MGKWTTLGKIAAYGAAPFTGGASLAAIPAINYYESTHQNKDALGNPSSNPSSDPNYTDPKKALSYFGSTGDTNINNLRSSVTGRTQGLENRFNVAADQSSGDYNNIQNGYQNFMNRSPISYQPSNQNFGAYSGYQNFADTGGFSGQDIQNLRARADAPIRATYANAQNDLSRRNVLAGGNLANAAASKAKMSRELSYTLGDQSLNTEAALADAIHSGKLAGLAGMTGIDTSKMSEGLTNAGQNLQAQGMESNRLLSGLSGQTSLYGATPGQASLYGNQMLNSSGQNVQVEQLRNQLMEAILSGALGNSALPSGFQKGVGNAATIMQLIGQGASLYGSYKGGGSSSNGNTGSYNGGQGGVYE